VTKIEIYTSPFCGYCFRAKNLLEKKQAEFKEVNVSRSETGWDERVERSGGARTMPQVFI
jgi:glutaredoxin 3